MSKLSATEQELAKALLAAIDELRRIEPDMQLPMAATLLIVALNDGASRTDVMRRLGVAGSTATRNLLSLTEGGRVARTGRALIEQRVDPEERRLRRHSLTPHGEETLRGVLASLRALAAPRGGGEEDGGAPSTGRLS